MNVIWYVNGLSPKNYAYSKFWNVYDIVKDGMPFVIQVDGNLYIVEKSLDFSSKLQKDYYLWHDTHPEDVTDEYRSQVNKEFDELLKQGRQWLIV